MPKKPKVQRRPKKPPSLTLEHAQALREHAQVINRLVSVVDALVEHTGREPLRLASARAASRASLTQLVIAEKEGRVRETQAVTVPGTCAVEFAEYDPSDGTQITPSVVVQLSQVPKDLQEKLAAMCVGGSLEHGGVRITIRRCWDVVTP